RGVRRLPVPGAVRVAVRRHLAHDGAVIVSGALPAVPLRVGAGVVDAGAAARDALVESRDGASADAGVPDGARPDAAPPVGHVVRRGPAEGARAAGALRLA